MADSRRCFRFLSYICVWGGRRPSRIWLHRCRISVHMPMSCITCPCHACIRGCRTPGVSLDRLGVSPLPYLTCLTYLTLASETSGGQPSNRATGQPMCSWLSVSCDPGSAVVARWSGTGIPLCLLTLPPNRLVCRHLEDVAIPHRFGVAGILMRYRDWWVNR